MGTLYGLGQQAQTPYAGQAETPQLLGAASDAYKAALQQGSQKQAGKNSMMSGIGTLAGAGIGTMIAPGVGTMMGASLGGYDLISGSNRIQAKIENIKTTHTWAGMPGRRCNACRYFNTCTPYCENKCNQCFT